jgi:hypothetical protein
MAVVKNKINANPDEAVKKMMADPYRRIYAWVYLDSSVINSLGADPSGQPTLNASSPIITLSRIEYQPMPMDPALVNSLPTFSGGGLHITTTKPVVIDLALITPPVEDLIGYAKARNLPTNELHAYASGRYQAALSSLQTVSGAQQAVWNAYQTTNDICKKLLAQFQIAKKSNDVELQKSLAEKASSVCQSLASMTDQFPALRESVQKSERDVKYWEHIVDLVKPAM